MEKIIKDTGVLNITNLKTIKKSIILILALAIILILLFGIIRIQDIVIKKIYPLKYNEYVEKYSAEYGIDSMLVYAIIKAESNFNPNTKSTSNAMGLMQLIEQTAIETAGKIGIEYTEGCLYDPETNINLGIKYYSQLLNEYDNNYMLALTAYNAGTGNVKKWIEQGIIKPDGSNIEDIPYKETNNYVRKIIRDYNIYKDLYN